MDNNQKLMDLLEQMEKANRKQVAYARLQFVFSVIAAICCILLLLAGVKVLPQLQEAALQADLPSVTRLNVRRPLAFRMICSTALLRAEKNVCSRQLKTPKTIPMQV